MCIRDSISGAPPPINLENEKKLINLMLKLTDSNMIVSAHDLSDGGLLPAICEMLFFNKLGINNCLLPQISVDG